MIKKIIYISLICIIIDQIIKVTVNELMILNSSKEIISNFFYISYVHNTGAAWSIFSGNRIFLILITIISLIIFYRYFIKNQNLLLLETISYGVLIGGIFGNLIDRVIHGYVIDYLDFIIFKYNFPIFNFADMCIVISVGLIIIKMFIGDDKDEKAHS